MRIRNISSLTKRTESGFQMSTECVPHLHPFLCVARMLCNDKGSVINSVNLNQKYEKEHLVIDVKVLVKILFI